MVNIFFRFWQRFSIFILTVTLLYCYASLPESIAVAHNAQGKPTDYIDKQGFFYWTAGVVFAFNLLMSLLSNATYKLDFRKILPSSVWANNNVALLDVLKGWFDVFVAIINTFLVFAILGLNNINATKGQVLDFNYNIILILGFVLILIVLISLPLRLLLSNPPVLDSE